MAEGLYKVVMNKHRSTWTWFCENPVGGGFGSNHCGSKKTALGKAIYGLAPGVQYRLVVNGKDEGIFVKGA